MSKHRNVHRYVHNPKPTTWEGWVKAYETEYPSFERRHEIAMRLADPNIETGAPGTMVSRNFLAAHWGDDPKTLRSAATFLYSLHDAVDSHVGQPIIVSTRGDIESFLADPDDVYDDIDIVYGRIATAGIIHGFRGNLGTGPKHMGVRPPYLYFGVQANVQQRTGITIPMLGEAIPKPSDQEIRPLPIYLGTVTLAQNLEAYQAQRTVQQRLAFVGQEACAPVIEALRLRGLDPDVLESLS